MKAASRLKTRRLFVLLCQEGAGCITVVGLGEQEDDEGGEGNGQGGCADMGRGMDGEDGYSGVEGEEGEDKQPTVDPHPGNAAIADEVRACEWAAPFAEKAIASQHQPAFAGFDCAKCGDHEIKALFGGGEDVESFPVHNTVLISNSL